MAIKMSTDRTGKTVIVYNLGQGKTKKTFPTKQDAISWYNQQVNNGATRQQRSN